MSTARGDRKRLWESMTKQGIVDAVVQVLGTQGLHGLTMDNVALQAGVAKGTLYVYFKNKQELLKATIEAGIGPLVKELNSVLDTDLPPNEKVERLILSHLGYFDRHRELFRVLIYDRQFAQARWKRYGTSRYQAFLKKLAGVLEEGCKAGLFRNLDFLKVAAMLIEADIAVIHQRLLSDEPASLEEDARLVAQVFFCGISEEPLREKTVLWHTTEKK